MATMDRIEALIGAVFRALMAASGGGGDSGGGGNNKKRVVLFGKGFEMMDKFSGGESKWNEWSGDFRTMVQTKSEMACEALIHVESVGKAEKDVMDWVEVMRSIKEAAADSQQEEVVQRFKELGKVSKELYRWLRLKTEGEEKLVVLAEENEGDGIKVLGPIHANTTKEQCQG